MLQLYKLTNTDVTLLEEEKEKLNELIKELKTILSDEKVLDNVIKEELKRIKRISYTKKNNYFRKYYKN